MAVIPVKRITGWHLAWSNLRARPLRSVLSIVAISLQVFLILLIVGLTSGILADLGERAEGVGRGYHGPTAQLFRFLCVLQRRHAGIGCRPNRRAAGVDESAPVLIVVDTANLGVIYGIDEPRFEGLSKGFRFISGHGLEKPDDAIADDLAARSRHLHVGDNVSLLNHPFHLAGIVLHGKARGSSYPSAPPRILPGQRSAFPWFTCAARAIPRRPVRHS